jgi:hypothetical protein
MLLICCFCDKVCDQALGHRNAAAWKDLQEAKKRTDAILAYTCCDNCLLHDPHAAAFRTRQLGQTYSSPKFLLSSYSLE